MEIFNRIIPCLLLDDGGLVKTRKFNRSRYVGDPINAVRIFNEKYVDELVFLDIKASSSGREPDYDLIERIASECFVPLCYGGGVKSLDQARKIISLGVEKIAVSSAAIDNPVLISQLAAELGSSSVVGVVDVKKSLFARKSNVYHSRTGKVVNVDPVLHAQAMVSLGAGEIFINSVDRDGEYVGYDNELIAKISKSVNVPVVACGGASSLLDMQEVIRAGASAAAAGSIFVFYGAHKAVLINYPEYSIIKELISE